jgi:hypothetical protein
MRRTGSILGLVCLIVVAVRADEPAGALPLESTKQELKKLRTEQTAPSGAVSGKFTDGLSQFKTPLPEPLQQNLLRPEELEREMKQRSEAQKNWLVDGVDNLEKAPATRSRPKDARGNALKSDENPETVDPHAPNYLLKLYTNQKRADETKSGQAKSSTGQVDPFAPFLQDWLGTSPARGKFFDEFVRKPGTDATGENVTGSTEPDGRQSLGTVDLALRPPVAARVNPYLQVLESSVAKNSSDSRGQTNQVITGLNTAASQPVSNGQQPPVAVERPKEIKPQWLAPADDKKYYPQQKKF